MFIVRQFLWMVICPAVFATCENEREQKIIAEIIEKLRNLGELRPNRCMRDAENMMKIEYPTFLTERESAVMVLELSFRSASELLEKDTTSTAWNSRELRQLKHLLRQQSDCYKRSFTVINSGEDLKNWNSLWTRLGDFLSQKNFSACAWESVRPVVLRIIRNFCRSIIHSRKQFPRQIKRC